MSFTSFPTLARRTGAQRKSIGSWPVDWKGPAEALTRGGVDRC
jgi:hypothetical protein